MIPHRIGACIISRRVLQRLRAVFADNDRLASHYLSGLMKAGPGVRASQFAFEYSAAIFVGVSSFVESCSLPPTEEFIVRSLRPLVILVEFPYLCQGH
jgi:hypothetical protein